MSEYLDWLRQGSQNHSVRLKESCLQVMPRDGSLEALIELQAIAEEVLRRPFVGEFEAKAHQTSEVGISGQGEKPYDLVMVWPCSS